MALLIAGFALSIIPVSTMAATALSASATPTDTSVHTGEEVTFIVTASGGTPPYKYQWYASRDIVPGATSAKAIITTRGSGTFTYYCKVTDSAGQTASSNKVTLTVTPPPGVLDASATPTSTSAETGNPVSYAVSVSGGTTPYTYQWFEGANPVSGQTSEQLTITKDAAGSYTYNCKITDAEGKTTVSNTVALEVTSTATALPESESTMPPETIYAIVAVVVIVVVLIAIAVVFRKRAH